MNNIIPLEYDGHPVRFNNDGWINATDIAAKFDKEPNDWLTRIDTLEYLVALSNKIYSNSCSVRELNKIKELEIKKSSSRVKILRLAKKNQFS